MRHDARTISGHRALVHEEPLIFEQGAPDKSGVDLSEPRIDEDRLESKGFGEDKPIASNKTRAGRAQNRRALDRLSTSARRARPCETTAWPPRPTGSARMAQHVLSTHHLETQCG